MLVSGRLSPVPGLAAEGELAVPEGYQNKSRPSVKLKARVKQTKLVLLVRRRRAESIERVRVRGKLFKVQSHWLEMHLIYVAQAIKGLWHETTWDALRAGVMKSDG